MGVARNVCANSHSTTQRPSAVDETLGCVTGNARRQTQRVRALRSLVEHAATKTITKLLLITNDDTDRSRGRGVGDGVTVLREALPCARHLGTLTRNSQRDNVIERDVIERVKRHLDAAGAAIDSPVRTETNESRDGVRRGRRAANGAADGQRS